MFTNRYKLLKLENSISHDAFQEYYGIRRSVLLIRENFLDSLEATTIFTMGCYLVIGNDGPFITSPRLSVAEVVNDTEHNTRVKYGTSSGFVITFQAEILDRTRCIRDTGLTINYRREPSHRYYDAYPNRNPDSFTSIGCTKT